MERRHTLADLFQVDRDRRPGKLSAEEMRLYWPIVLSHRPVDWTWGGKVARRQAGQGALRRHLRRCGAARAESAALPYRDRLVAVSSSTAGGDQKRPGSAGAQYRVALRDLRRRQMCGLSAARGRPVGDAGATRGDRQGPAAGHPGRIRGPCRMMGTAGGTTLLDGGATYDTIL